MNSGTRGLPRGVVFALGSAVLFALSTPAAKRLLGDIHPVLLAGLLYGGSGVGLFLLRLVRGTRSQAALTRHDALWLAGAVLFGGILGPVLSSSRTRTTTPTTSTIATCTPRATPRASRTRTSTPTPLHHRHPHYPDIHHRHAHDGNWRGTGGAAGRPA